MKLWKISIWNKRGMVRPLGYVVADAKNINWLRIRSAGGHSWLKRGQYTRIWAVC